jgi:hypothetical protein
MPSPQQHGAGTVTLYKLEVLEPPDERLRHRREFQAEDDEAAIKWADDFCDGVAADPNVRLDRYVLYDGSRVVEERVKKRS